MNLNVDEGIRGPNPALRRKPSVRKASNPRNSDRGDLFIGSTITEEGENDRDISATVDESQDLRIRILCMEDQLVKATGENKLLMDQVNEYKATISRLNHEIQEMSISGINEASIITAETEAINKALEAEKKHLLQKNADLGRKVFELEESMAMVESANIKLQEKDEVIKKQNERYDKLASELESYILNYNKAMTTIEKLEEVIDTLKKRQSDIQKIKEDYFIQEEHAKMMEDRYAQKCREVETLQSTVESMDAKITQLTLENERAVQACDRMCANLLDAKNNEHELTLKLLQKSPNTNNSKEFRHTKTLSQGPDISSKK